MLQHGRFPFLYFLSSLLLCTLLIQTVALAEPAKKQKKIGVIVALTGPLASVGVSIKNAAGLAKEKFDPNDTVQFLFDDDQFQSKNAIIAAEKFISQDHVDALITFSGATSAAVSELAERRKVPMVGITALSTIGKSKSFVYSLFIGARPQVEMLSQAADTAGFQRIALLTTVHESMLEMHKIFVDLRPARIVREEEVQPGDIQLSSVATKILAEKPDAIVLFLLPPQISAAARFLRTQGFQGQFIGGPPVYNPPEIKSANGALTGIWLPGPSSHGSSEFLAEYAKRFNEPCISEGLYGYDTASLLIQAAKSDDIAKHLRESKSFPGLVGEYPKRENNVFDVPVELKKISSDGTLQSSEK